MNTIRILLVGLILSTTIYTTSASINDPELDQAVTWMYENQMTKFNNSVAYWPANTLTREQAAKFFVNFTTAMDLDLEEKVSDSQCTFTDLEGADTSLTEYIYTSCKLGLFKGAKGYFFPTESITKAQALTVLIRALEGVKDETTIPRRKNYYEDAKALSLTKEKDVYALDVDITRYEMALILYRASGENSSTKNNTDQINELIKILKELGLQSS